MKKTKETVEEAAEKFYPPKTTDLICSPKLVRDAFIAGANWQAKRMYSEEDLHNAFYNGWLYRGEDYQFPKAKKEWLKKFKKK